MLVFMFVHVSVLNHLTDWDYRLILHCSFLVCIFVFFLNIIVVTTFVRYGKLWSEREWTIM